MMAASLPLMTHGRVVGALACQINSYLRSLETQVIACDVLQSSKKNADDGSKSSKKSADDRSNMKSSKGKSNGSPPAEIGVDEAHPQLWKIECADSVLFPEGGGQPSDHGTLLPLDDDCDEPITIKRVQREGLRCVLYSPKFINPGTKVRQQVDFARRWDHMHQHTGQHLLTAVMNTYENLATLSWSMGAGGEMNYVELPRKPSSDEIHEIQRKCNEYISNNLSITVTNADGSQAKKLPDDYDEAKGVVRVVKIADLDNNTCCGTHLRQTSHISLLLLHHTQTVRSTNCRIFFTAGDRAINLATSSIESLQKLASMPSISTSPSEVVAGVKRLSDSVAQLKKNEKKLLEDLAKFEAKQAREALQKENKAVVYRPDGGMDFINMVIRETKDVMSDDNIIVLLTGCEQQPGQLLIVGGSAIVDEVVQKAKEAFKELKGGGKAGRWQGKLGLWDKAGYEKFMESIGK